MSDYKQQAKELSKPLLEAIEMCVIKHQKAVIEQVHNELKVRCKPITLAEVIKVIENQELYNTVNGYTSILVYPLIEALEQRFGEGE